MTSQEWARNSPWVGPSEGANSHRKEFQEWANYLREVGRERKPHISRQKLEKLLENDPQPTESVALLIRTTAAILKKKWTKDKRYYLIAEKDEKELLGAFVNLDGEICAPHPANLFSFPRFPTSFVFKIREKKQYVKQIFVTIADGKLDVIGNRRELFSFL